MHVSVEVDPPPCNGVGHSRPTTTLYRGEDRLCGVPGEFFVTRCPDCGLGGTSPRLDDERIAAYYPSSYPAYRKAPTPTSWRGRIGASIDAARFSFTVRMAAFGPLLKRPPGRLLDVGCGRGELAAWFLARGWDVAGVEPGSAACEDARSAGIEMHCGTLDDAPWGEGSFDAITFNHSLEHIPNPEFALRRAREMLAKDGRLIISVPNFACWQRRLFGSRWFHLDLPRHLQHFDPDSLPAMLLRADLHVLSVRTTSSMSGIVGSLQYALWGRSALSDAAMFRLMHLFYPLVALADRFSQGDCLHVMATPRG